MTASLTVTCTEPGCPAELTLTEPRHLDHMADTWRCIDCRRREWREAHG